MMNQNVTLKIVDEPSSVPQMPEVECWLEKNDGRIHLMCKNESGEPRKVFSIYPDGKGYLNKNRDTRVKGLTIDSYGRIELRDSRGLCHIDSCRNSR